MRRPSNIFSIAIILSISGCATYRTILPEISEPQRQGLSLKSPVFLAVLDGRGHKTDTETITNTLQEGLRRTYSNCIEITGFFSKIPNDRVAVRIRLLALGANFGSRIISSVAIANATSTAQARAQAGWHSVAVTATSTQNIFASSFSGEGWWIGTAWLEIDIQDNRKGKDISFTLPIAAEARESNTFGYSSASTAAQNAWNIVSAQLIRTLDSVLMNLRDQE